MTILVRHEVFDYSEEMNGYVIPDALEINGVKMWVERIENFTIIVEGKSASGFVFYNGGVPLDNA